MVRRERLSNYELLRIIAMIMIVAHHFVFHGGLHKTDNLLSVNGIYIYFLLVGGKIGVNLFVMISGYFMIMSKNFRISKVIKLYLQVMFYSLLCYAGYICYSLIVQQKIDFSFWEVIKNIFPMIYERWWFASTYIVLLLLSPFLNKLLNNLSQALYLKLLIMLFIIWSVIPTIFLKSLSLNNLIWFVFVYSLAGYIRLYGINIFNKRKSYLWSSVLLYGITVAFNLVCALLKDIPMFNAYSVSGFAMMNLLPVFLTSLSIFLLFEKIEIKTSKAINTIALSTFGVYLIHDNSFIRTLLKQNVYSRFGADSSFLIPYTIAAILLIFAVCGGIELLRVFLIENRYMKFFTEKDKIISEKIDAVVLRLINKGNQKKSEETPSEYD